MPFNMLGKMLILLKLRSKQAYFLLNYIGRGVNVPVLWLQMYDFMMYPLLYINEI